MNSSNEFRLPHEVSATMSAYARLVDEKLPGRIGGLYLSGSLALDDYQAGRNDIDFVAISDPALQGSLQKRGRRLDKRSQGRVFLWLGRGHEWRPAQETRFNAVPAW